MKNKKNKQKIDLFDFNPITFPKIREAYGWQYSASDCADIENGKTTKISKKMKLTLDFDKKTVHVDEPCNLKEFFDFMMKQGGLQEWTVEGSERVVYYPANPVVPWYAPTGELPITTRGTGEYNIDQPAITTTDGAFKRENIDPGNSVGMEGRCITEEQIKEHNKYSGSII